MDLFVGRRAELQGALTTLRAAGDGIVQDVIGVHGIGKTMFLERLADEARALDRAQVFTFDMARHGLGEGFFDDFGPAATAQVLWATFDCSRRLMRRLVDHAGTDGFNRFRLAHQQQSRLADSFFVKTDVALGRGSHFEDSEIVNAVSLGDEYIRQRIREMQSALDEAFISDWAAYTRHRRVLITADTFQGVANDELGHWMARTALRLPNTLLVLARTPSAHVLADSDRFHKHHLTNFSPDEVHDYLARRFPDEKPRPQVTDVVHTFTDGHPGGVKLAADLIGEVGPADLSARRLRRILEHLPAAPNERWAELVHLILRAVDEPRLREAVDAAALTTSFDGPLLAQLLGGDGVPRHPIGDVISKLRAYRLVKPVPVMAGEPADRFRLHEFIRVSVAGRLRTTDKERWQHYHRLAAQYWFERLERWEDEAYDSYGSWFRYEDAEWQAAKREWLRHSSRFTERREITRARFTLVFLDAFWWWGVYLPFPFNRRLLDDWERSAAIWRAYAQGRPLPIEESDSPDRQLLDALTFLLDNYPTGYIKPQDAPWDELRDQILLIKDLCELDRPHRRGLSDSEQLDRARAGALTDVILAHTRRFRDPADPRADLYYQRSLEAFDRLGSDWDAAWVLLESADLAVERGRPDEAAEFVSRSAERARDLAARTDEWDHEILANLHRIRADASWLSGDAREAAIAYGRAVCHAYLFHGDPHPPDEYTRQVYIEITTRAGQAIEALPDGDDRDRFVATLRGELPPGWAAGRRTPDPHRAEPSASLFPRGPAEDELRTKKSPFMSEWRLLAEDVPDPMAGLKDLIGRDRPPA
ncbi:hypothetical protein GCM10023196_035010 [Actinoallomurus vinaceus]|uniref:Orc1-like AAA ATPase domain-containing protein n=1 Tax=Actinoallomurus vinaceus TaxID=1080074 RepID=A0ABP8U8P6_9ACTN